MRRAAAAAIVAALALGACGDDSDTPTSAGGTTESTAGGEHGGEHGGGGSKAGTAIVIKNFKFEPEKLSAKVGDKIQVTNQDSAPHTLTAKDKSVDTGDLAEGASGTITLSKAGTIDYVCEIHDYMTGSIEVK